MPLYADGTKDEIWSSISKHTKGRLYFGNAKTAYYDEGNDTWSFTPNVTAGGATYAILATSDNIAYTSAAPLGALANGAMVGFKMPAANSGAACTVDVNGLGAKKMFRSSDQSTQITTNDLIANGIYFMQYNTTLDTAAGGWVVMNTPATSNFFDLTTAQTAAGAKKFSGAVTMASTLNYAVAATADNIAYTLAVEITSLANGCIVAFKMPAVASAGAVTLAVNSLAAKKCFLSGLNATQVNSGDLEASAIYIAEYNSALDTATGGWVIYGAGLVHRTGTQTIAGAKTLAGVINYALLTTSDNIAYVSSVPITALANGDLVVVKVPNAASAGAVTLDVNSLGAKKCFLAGQVATQLNTGDIEANATYLAEYNTTIDSATGGWIFYGAGTVNRTGAQTIAGIKTFTANQVQAVTCNYVLAVRGSAGHFTAAVAITSLVPGAEIRIKMPAASDATSALAVNSLTEKKMLKASDRTTQIGASDMKSGGVYRLLYDDSVDSAAGAWLVDSL